MPANAPNDAAIEADGGGWIADDSGFREYDCRWQYPEQLNHEGAVRLGRAIGTLMHQRGMGTDIVVGRDYRSYSEAVQTAVIEGLLSAGIDCHDIGLCLTPTAYFAQYHLGIDCVAMITASHNPNGWTGVKLGFEKSATFGPDDMKELKTLFFSGGFSARQNAVHIRKDIRAEYLADLAHGCALGRPIRAVVACANGTAGLFAPDLLAKIGVEVVPLHCALDHNFPNYNPNPETLEMLDDIGTRVRETKADIGLGFDGDGDRCGVVDENGLPVFADKLGVLLARKISRGHDRPHFVVDVKSTALFERDPILDELGATVEYWKTGHSHVKRRLAETGAVAAFEKSGHFFFAPPIGRGYDCGLRTAVECLRLLDANPSLALSRLVASLPKTFGTPTMSPACADDRKYDVVAEATSRLANMMESGEPFGGATIARINTVNGARITLSDGDWALVRASSNSPNLVVVAESFVGAAKTEKIVSDLDRVIRKSPGVGAYDQCMQ